MFLDIANENKNKDYTQRLFIQYKQVYYSSS